MLDKVIDRWIRWRYFRWEVRIADEWERRLTAQRLRGDTQC
jgi:hypothetical protein